MKKLTMALMLISVSLFAQSYLEIEFEQSEYYFNRQLLNPFGMKKFYDIIPGFVDNIFTNIHLNPVKITELRENYLFYADLRGAREEPQQGYVYPQIQIYTIPNVIIPPIYFIPQITEPEPRYSIGFVTKLDDYVSDRFFIGGTFQRITKDDMMSSPPFYPFPINQFTESIERDFLGKNELKFRGNIYSLFGGYKFDERFSMGFSFNGINYNQDGIIDEKSYYEYLTESYRMDKDIKKNSDYDHQDFTFGLNYSLNAKANIGIKTGLLKGRVLQSSTSINLYLNKMNIPDVSSEWRYDYNLYNFKKDFNKDGKIYYSGFDFNLQLNEKFNFFGYFNFATGKIDFNGKFNQFDSSYYYFKYFVQPNAYWSKSLNERKNLVDRSGKGVEEKTDYAGLLGVKVKILPSFNISLGISYTEKHLEKSLTEPTKIYRLEKYRYETTNPGFSNVNWYDVYSEESENEIMQTTKDYLYQIPVMFDFKLAEIGELILILNQRTGGGKVEETLINRIKERIRTINDSTIHENNIVYKYTTSSVKPYIDEAEAIAGIKIFISRKINLNLLIDPELFRQPRIAQWWLSLEGRF